MEDRKELILQMNEDGVWGIKPEPYGVVEVATEEDWNYFIDIVERNKAKTPLEFSMCPNCRQSVAGGKSVSLKFCTECGQKLDWTEYKD